MQIKATHIGNNPIKVPGSSSDQLAKFRERELAIGRLEEESAALNTQIAESVAKLNELKASDGDKNEIKKLEETVQTATDKLNEKEKELTDLKNTEQKVVANLSGVTFLKENTPTPAEPVAEASEEHSLSDELSDFSFDMPATSAPVVETTSEPGETTQEAPVANPVAVEPETTDMPTVETVPEGPTVDSEEIEPTTKSESETPENAELPQVDISEIKPEIPTESVSLPEEPITVNLAPVTPDYDFDQPVIPATDEEVEQALVSSEQDEEKVEGSENSEEEPTVTPEDIATIDSIINGSDKTDIELEEEKEEIKAEPTNFDTNIFDKVPESEPTSEMPIEDDVEKDDLKNLIRFKSYRAWENAFAEVVYGKSSFTLDELDNLSTKPGYISEQTFLNERQELVDSLITKKEQLERENNKLNVKLNASETFANNVTNELNDTKASLEELQGKYKKEVEKGKTTKGELNDTKQRLKETEDELDGTKKQLEETQSELDEVKDTLSRKNQKIKEYNQLMKNTFSVLSDMQDEKIESEEMEQGESKRMAA